jgi:membrane protease subunit HflK
MAWNEPGGSGGDKDPWGSKRPGDGPPDLDEALRKLQDKLGRIFGGGGRRGGGNGSKSPRGGLGGILVALALGIAAWLIYDATYIIDQAERGVVLRFGKFVDTLKPGINARFPRPIEHVLRVNVEEVRIISLGNTKTESLMLTQDENVIDIKFTVQYQVSDPRKYLFNVLDPDVTLRQITESAVREIVGKSKMDYVITEGREDVAAKAGALIQTVADSYGLGLLVQELNMQNAQPPQEVQAAFDDAVKAREDEVRYKNEAEAYARNREGKASGTSQRILLEADAYKQRVVESATGEAARFTKLRAEYEKAPAVTRERLYIEAVEDVMSRTGKVMVDTKGGNNLLYLPLDKLIERQGVTRQPVPVERTNESDFGGSDQIKGEDAGLGRAIQRSRGGYAQ